MTSVGVQGKQLERALVISGTWLHSSNWCCLPYEACLDILQRVSGGYPLTPSIVYILILKFK
jgi:hypothetical protein